MTSAEVMQQADTFFRWWWVVAVGGVPIVALIGFLNRDY